VGQASPTGAMLLQQQASELSKNQIEKIESKSK